MKVKKQKTLPIQKILEKFIVKNITEIKKEGSEKEDEKNEQKK